MKIGYAEIAYRNSLNTFFKTLRLSEECYLLNTSFKAFAGKNLTFCDAAIWICSPVLGFLPTLIYEIFFGSGIPTLLYPAST